jgi:hypothetical protein
VSPRAAPLERCWPCEGLGDLRQANQLRDGAPLPSPNTSFAMNPTTSMKPERNSNPES